MSGFYLAIEGGEGVGKTTVVALLAEALNLRGEEVVTVREPGSTDLGNEVRRLLLHWQDMTPWAEALLYAAQRAELVSGTIAPALARGSFVLSDRSLYSSLAYQGVARGLGTLPGRQSGNTGAKRSVCAAANHACGRAAEAKSPGAALPQSAT